MKKLIIVILLLLSSSSFAQTAQVLQIDQNGFNGIKWGTDIGQLKDMVLIDSSDNNSVFHKKENNEIMLENVLFNKIVYFFENSKFRMVSLQFNIVKKPYLISRLTEKYGKPNSSDNDSAFWTVLNINIDVKNGVVYLGFNRKLNKQVSGPIEPDGFNGIKWGTDISELKDMIVSYVVNDSVYYKKKDDSMVIENVYFNDINYYFKKNKFETVILSFDISYKPYLMDRLTETYGTPLTKEGQNYWANSNSVINVRDDKLFILYD